METIVTLSKKAEKNLKKLPKHILVQFDLRVETIETDGLGAMQKVKGYRDHAPLLEIEKDNAPLLYLEVGGLFTPSMKKRINLLLKFWR
jgi:hypothetical protein